LNSATTDAVIFNSIKTLLLTNIGDQTTITTDAGSYTIPTNVRALITGTATDAAVIALASGLYRFYFTYRAFSSLLPSNYNIQSGIIKFAQNADIVLNKATLAEELQGISSMLNILFGWTYTPQ